MKDLVKFDDINVVIVDLLNEMNLDKIMFV